MPKIMSLTEAQLKKLQKAGVAITELRQVLVSISDEELDKLQLDTDLVEAAVSKSHHHDHDSRIAELPTDVGPG